MSHTADHAIDLPAPTVPEQGSAQPVPHAVATAPPASPTLSLDGELPRLGTSAVTAPVVPGPAPAPEAPAATALLAGVADHDLPTLPAVAPILTEQGTTSSAEHPAQPTDGAARAGGHPMSHMMAPKSAPSEASRKAAEIRAAKKAKARKVKIGVALGAIVFAAVVGPPLVRWFGNAISEAGSTSTEQPAD